MVLRLIALGLSLKIPGLNKFFITPLRKRKRIQIMTLPMEITQLVLHMKSLSLRKLRKDAEFQRLASRTARKDQRLCHGKKSKLRISQPTGTGETLRVRTTSLGPRTSTSQSIVDHAGLKELLQLLLIDSTLCSEKT